MLSLGHVARGSPQMMSLANSLIYQRLFQQNDSGEKVHEGSAAEKAVTYDLGVKGIPDDVVWALSAVNLDQYDVPQWVQASNHPIFYLPDFFSFLRLSACFSESTLFQKHDKLTIAGKI